MYKWTNLGYTPLKVYKALCAIYGDPTRIPFEKLHVEKVHEQPFRLAGPGIEELTRRWEREHQEHPFHFRRLANVPRRRGPLYHNMRQKLEMEAAEAALNFPAPTPAPAPAAAPQATGPVFTPAASEEHAGMVALARLCADLKQQRDEALLQVVEVEKKVSQAAREGTALRTEYESVRQEKDRLEHALKEAEADLATMRGDLQSLRGELTRAEADIKEYRALLDEATRTATLPKAPAPAPKVVPAQNGRAEGQRAEATAVLREIDPGLAQELEAFNRP